MTRPTESHSGRGRDEPSPGACGCVIVALALFWTGAAIVVVWPVW